VSARGTGAVLFVAVCVLGLSRPAAADDDEEARLESRWPLEWIARPQTLPRGMLQLDITGQGTIPNHRNAVDPVSGYSYQFYPAFQLGLSLAAGLGERWEISAWYPRALCLSEAQPSACDPTNRYRGAGAGGTYGFLRGERVQGAFTAELELARSSPFELEWLVDAWFKMAASPRLAFGLTVSARRAINPPAQDLVASTFGSLDLGLTLQATRRLALFSDLIPWAAMARVSDGVALEIMGGATYTFSHELQVGLQASSSNVLSNPPWNQTVPAWFVAADLVWWVDWEGPGIIQP